MGVKEGIDYMSYLTKTHEYHTEKGAKTRGKIKNWTYMLRKRMIFLEKLQLGS